MNFNDAVKVKLTGVGEHILREQHDDLNEHILNRGGRGIGPYVSKADEEGYSTFQIWDLMQRLGPHMSIAKPEPFKGEMVFLNGEPIELGETEAKEEHNWSLIDAQSKIIPAITHDLSHLIRGRS